MQELFYKYAGSKFYWWSLALLCVALEASALFYQYALDYGPCVLCIHVRILVMAIFLVSLVGIFFRQSRTILLFASIAMTGLWGWMLERSYMLLGIERGFVTGSCSFDSGMPAWFKIDKWFPFMFQIWESCGYTPVLLFGITMAEVLLVMSAVLLLLSLIVVVNIIRGKILFNQ